MTHIISIFLLFICPTVKIMTPPMDKTDTTVKARVFIQGGKAPFTYLWQNGTTNSTCTISSVGGYQFIVQLTDGNGCVVRDTLIITE